MRIAIVYPDDSNFDLSLAASHFPEDVLRNMDAMNDSARRDHIAGRIALSRAAGKPLACDLTVRYSESGQPHMVGSDAHCTVSHSRAWGAAAVAETHVIGIDIEYIRAHHDALIDYVSTSTERAVLQSLKNVDVLTLMWTAKEAVMKAEGKGLMNPRSLEIINLEHVRGSTILTVQMAPGTLGCILWFVYVYTIPTGNMHLSVAIPAHCNETITFDRDYSGQLHPAA